MLCCVSVSLISRKPSLFLAIAIYKSSSPLRNSQPAMGFIPYFLHSKTKSMTPIVLLMSVNAIAGICRLLACSTRFSMEMVPKHKLQYDRTFKYTTHKLSLTGFFFFYFLTGFTRLTGFVFPHF